VDCLIELFSASAEETQAIGQRISGRLAPPSVIAIRGGLGSGKTCLAKGIAKGFGISETITSPTYTIINEYSGSIPFYHIDAYRLENGEEFDLVGGRQLLSGNGIYIIEWSDRIGKSLPDNSIKIEIEITGPQARLIRIRGLELYSETK
jgi:tRNA threonylcarbamoyladenosine biosynthesis protein TsaE